MGQTRPLFVHFYCRPILNTMTNIEKQWCAWVRTQDRSMEGSDEPTEL